MTNATTKARPVSLHALVTGLLDHASGTLNNLDRHADHSHDDTCRLEGAVLALTSLRDLAPLPIDLHAAHLCTVNDLSVDGTEGPHSDEAIRSNATELRDALDTLADLLHGPLVMYDAWQDRFTGTRSILELLEDLDQHRPTSIDGLDHRLDVALDAA